MTTAPAVIRTRRAFATAAMVGVLAYVAVDVLLQLLPPYYDPIRDAESNLAVGPFGWIMNLNFLGRALTTVCAVGALRLFGQPSPVRGAGLVLFGAGGVASALLAFFATDVDVVAGSGLASYTLTGRLHLLIAGAGFVAAFLAIILLTLWLRRTRVLGNMLPAEAFAALTAIGALWLAVTHAGAPETLGLAERVCLLGILGWTFVVCAGIRRSSGESTSATRGLSSNR
jgi:hypothetical protein